MRFSKFSIIANIPLLIGLIDLLEKSHSLLIRSGIVPEEKSGTVMAAMAIAVFVLAVLPIVVQFMGGLTGNGEWMKFVATAFAVVALVGFCWDIITMIVGFFAIIQPTGTGRIVCLVLATGSTGICFVITMILLPAVLSDSVFRGFWWRALFLLIFLAAFSFDLCTSYSGNATLIWRQPVANSGGWLPVAVLACGTLLISLSQFYLYWYITSDPDEIG